MRNRELPEDSDRNPDGTLKAWPQWVQEGKPSPTGRFTFTSWRLWKKSEAPVESGLVGPVTLRVAVLENAQGAGMQFGLIEMWRNYEDRIKKRDPGQG